jgi:hypothetical protein
MSSDSLYYVAGAPSCGTYTRTSAKPEEKRGLHGYRPLWNLRALVSVAGVDFERKQRYTVSGRDGARGRGAFPGRGSALFFLKCQAGVRVGKSTN